MNMETQCFAQYLKLLLCVCREAPISIKTICALFFDIVCFCFFLVHNINENTKTLQLAICRTHTQ